jgi:hypothetical protein
MHDELTLGARSHADLPSQDVLIRQYCLGLEDRIREAKDPAAAAQIAEKACRGFDRTCESSIIRSMLRKVVHDLHDRHWKSHDHHQRHQY